MKLNEKKPELSSSSQSPHGPQSSASPSPKGPVAAKAQALAAETFPVELPLRYQYEEALLSKDKLVIFLHGYMDHGPSLARRVLRNQNLGIPWLAPNAPFPVPVRTANGFREAYSWYFMDADKNEILISPKIAANMLLGLLEKLNLLNREVIIVGFSQGGFFAPYVASGLKNMKKVIGVGSAYKEESYSPPQLWHLDAIHGQEDDIVSLQKAKDSIEVLKGKGQSVNLIVVPEIKHEVSPEIADQILKSIYEVWPKI